MISYEFFIGVVVNYSIEYFIIIVANHAIMTIPTPLLQLLKMFQGCSICSLIPTRN
jgi:hypothetical protein